MRRNPLVISTALVPDRLHRLPLPKTAGTDGPPPCLAHRIGRGYGPIQRAPSVSFDKSLSDVLDDLDNPLFLSGHARKDRLVLLGDIGYSSMDVDYESGGTRLDVTMAEPLSA
ncbi:hypothetical protein [Paracoccus denitrificans]|uniref:hypothetical protein n=1 Tax=Paracoccus denitrificans TaxID=266 RepID=UPI001319E46E|nr:hypothetical protein [Paracoccus denitrificans]